MAETVIQGEREAWLAKSINLLSPLFEAEGYPLPPVRVTCGWPSRMARPSKKQRLGECWSGQAAEDGVPQIFITPMLSETGAVLATLLHELAHAAVGTEVGHKGPFVRLIRALGLLGVPTATYAGADVTTALLERVVYKGGIGQYPHAALKLVQREKQTTRMKKAMCNGCGCIIRLTQKWVDEGEERGGLVCPICAPVATRSELMEVAA